MTREQLVKRIVGKCGFAPLRESRYLKRNHIVALCRKIRQDCIGDNPRVERGGQQCVVFLPLLDFRHETLIPRRRIALETVSVKKIVRLAVIPDYFLQMRACQRIELRGIGDGFTVSFVGI